MIKVLQIISDTNIGGAGRVLLNYLQACQRSQYEIHVALPHHSLLLPHLESAGAICHPVQGLADRSYHKEDVALLKKIIKELNPQVIHTHGAFSGRIAAKLCGVPVVFSRHSVFPVTGAKKYPPFTWLNGLLNCFFSNAIIAVSPAAADNLVELGVPRKKITTIMNGVAPVILPSAPHTALMRSQLHLPENPKELFIFGILARLEVYKGHKLLLQSCADLKKQGHHFMLLIAGTGPEEETLQTLTKELELEDCVQFLGFIQDIPGLLSLLSAQVNSSFGTEATSLSLLEGMSVGIPAIVSDYGGNPFVIADNKNGLVFPQENQEALTKAMKKLLTDTALQDKLTIGAKAVFQETFTNEIFAKNTEQVYKTLAERKS